MYSALAPVPKLGALTQAVRNPFENEALHIESG